MATKDLITKVWIEPGCIVCDACETSAPTVFEVQEETCIIRPAAMAAAFTKPLTAEIIDAAEECPVDVIKFETVTEEVADDQPTATESTPAAEKPAAEKPPAAKAPAAKAPAATAATEASTVGQPDPAIAALLKAATSRGGNAGILRGQELVPESTRDWDRKDPRDLPPDAKQAKVFDAAKKAANDPSGSRRGFLSKAALATGWVTFGGSLAVSAGPAFYRFMMPNVLEEPDPRVRIGKLQRYREMVPNEVNEDYKPQGIWIVRDGDRIAALSIICTHLGCIPNWLPNDRKFKCPCHGSGYKPNGINFEGPTPRPLERFRIYIQDGVVVVDKSKKYQYELGQWDQPGSYLEV